MKPRTVNSLIGLLLCILSWRASAQVSSQPAELPTAQESSTRLEDLVVTGTRTPKLQGEGPVKTEVLGKKEISERQYRDASEALMDIPGITLVDSTGKEGKSAILQGMGGEHVLVLMDGAPLLQNASSGVDLTQISAADIERIEVVKGGASALYGGQAMGGVINIITKKEERPFAYELEVGHDQNMEAPSPDGVNPYSLAKMHLSGRVKKSAYKLSLNQRKSNSIDRDSTSVARDTPDIEKLDAKLAVKQELGKGENLDLELGYNKESSRSYSARLQPNGAHLPSYNDGDVERGRVKLGYDKNISQTSSFKAYALTENTRDLLSMEDDPRTAEAESLKKANFRRHRAEAQFDFSPKESQITSLGVVAEQNLLDQSTASLLSPGQTHETIEVANRSSQSIEAYAQQDWMLEQQEWVLGLRLTHDPAFGNHFDPKLNYLYQPNWFANMKSAVRASVGTGYRIPNLKERFYILDHRTFAGYIVYGNENLRPEESLNYQLGFELNRDRDLAFGTNLFLNQVQGLILSTEIPNPGGERIFRYENLNSALIYGLETNLSWQATSRFRIQPSFTYTKAVSGEDGLIVPNRPFYLAQMNLRYDVGGKGSNLNATFRYFGDAYATTDNTEMYQAYSVLDLRYNHEINSNFRVYGGVKNLFDTTRPARGDSPDMIYDQRPEEGRSLVLGLSIEG